MKFFLASVVVSILCGCDTVTDTYPTLTDAEKARLFERGWLPNILPQSANRILTSNNLDTNTSKGEFYFSPSDAKDFLDQIKSTTPVWSEKEPAKFTYSHGRSSWIFICTIVQGYCAYTLRHG